MTYQLPRWGDTLRYRVRVVSPDNERFDEYVISTSKKKAHQRVLEKYGKGHKALVLDSEPTSIFK
jgi:ribosomal protein L19